MVATLLRENDLASEEVAELTPRNIARAWEDRNFRARLTPRQLLQLPAHPAGGVRLMSEMDAIANNVSSDNCSSSNCSSNNCSSSNCSSDNCSSSNCSSSNCSSDNCSGNVCTNYQCGG